MQKQQPCEDCISRKEALRHRHIIYDDEGVGYSMVRVDEIEQLPSVTPKAKIGHWITTRTPVHLGEFYCDKCKCYSPNNIKWDYCPDCGAKMEV